MLAPIDSTKQGAHGTELGGACNHAAQGTSQDDVTMTSQARDMTSHSVTCLGGVEIRDVSVLVF